MDEYPGIKFVTTPEGRRAVLASRPRLSVVDLLGTWQADGQNVRATARYFEISEDDVRAVIRYYSAFRDELGEEIRQNLAAQQNFERAISRNRRPAPLARQVRCIGTHVDTLFNAILL